MVTINETGTVPDTKPEPDYSEWESISELAMTEKIDKAYGLIVEAVARCHTNLTVSMDQYLLYWHEEQVAYLSDCVRRAGSKKEKVVSLTEISDVCSSRFVEVDRKRNAHKGDGSSVRPNEYGGLSATHGGRYLVYYPSRSAVEMLKDWGSAARMRWEVAESGLPTAVHLAPATNVERKLRLFIRSKVRPHMMLPTTHLDRAARVVRCRDIEETRIAADGVTIAIPGSYFTTRA